MDTLIAAPDFTICQRVLSGHWKLAILEELAQPKRFGELQCALSLKSRSVLAVQLQELMEMRLVARKEYACFPPKVEYSLTEGGNSLRCILCV